MLSSSTNSIPAVPILERPRSQGGLEDEDLSLRQIIRILRRRKQTVLGTGLIVGLLTIVISFVMRPYYASTATIEISSKAGASDAAVGELGSSTVSDIDTKIEIETDVAELMSEGLGVKTIVLTRFEDHVDLQPTLFRSPHRVPEERGLPLEQAPATREALLKEFETHLKVMPIPNTRLIQVTFEDPSPDFAAQTAKALVEEYVKEGLDRRNSSTVQASEWMSSQITSLKEQVQEAQQRLIDYQSKTGLVYSPALASAGGGAADSGSNGGIVNPQLARLTQLNESLVNAEANRIAREAVYRVAKTGNVDALMNMSDQGAGAAFPGAGSGVQPGSFAGLQGLRTQQSQLRLELASALQTFGAKNPHLLDIQKRLDEVETELREEVARVIARSELDFRVAQQAEDGLRASYDQAEREVDKMNDAELRLAVLQQEAGSTRTLYEDLFTKLQESKLQEGIQKSNVSLISPAMPPSRPLRPKKILYTVIGILVGLALGTAAAFVRESLDDTVISSTEVEHLTGMPLLGWIPGFKLHRVRPSEPAEPQPTSLKMAGGELNFYAHEGYRTLRTSLLLSQAGAPPKTILFTSPLPGEGKTTTTFNLAMSFAGMGQRVLALDADMRKPGLHEKFHTANRAGLSNLLTSNTYIDDVVFEMPEVPNLHLISAGQLPPNPPELLGSSRFGLLLSELAKRYDVIMLDSPPTVLLTDAMIVAAQVDAVVVVVRAGRTTRAVLTRMVDTLRLNRSKVLGFVLNEVDTSSAEFYYGNGYYGSKYGKGYYGSNS